MKSALRAAATGLLRHVPVPVWRRLFPKSVVGLCYHIVSDAEVGHVLHYPFLDTAAFEADLHYLRRTFGFISYDDLAKRRRSGGEVRDNVAIVTFDDGFAELILRPSQGAQRIHREPIGAALGPSPS